MDGTMKLLINNIKSEKKKKTKSLDKIKILKTELIKVKYAIKPNKLQSELKELKQILVVNKNLHEIKQEILVDYTGEFDMAGKLSVGDQIREKHVRFRNFFDYQAFINAIDQDYQSEDTIFNGCIYRVKTAQFNLVNTSQYGNG